MQVLIFCEFVLKMHIHAPIVADLRILPPKSEQINVIPKGTSCAETRHNDKDRPLLVVKIGPAVRT